MEKVTIIHQLTGRHGRGAVEVYKQLFKNAIPEATITCANIKVQWNALGLNSHIEAVAAVVKQAGANSILVFLGAAWHSRASHKNPALRAAILNTKALRVGIFQESYLAKRSSTPLIREMKNNYNNTCGLFDIEIFNHYRDYLTAQTIIREKSRPSKILYLPFLNPADEQGLISTNSSTRRENRIIFVGDSPSYPGNPYLTRHCLLERASQCETFDWIKPSTSQHVPHQDYMRALCSYNFALIPPSIDSSLTVRQIEACAAGAIPLTPSPTYCLEKHLFKDGYNCFYYKPFDDINEFFERMCSLPPSRVEEVRFNAFNTANSLTASNIAPKLRSLLVDNNILNGHFEELISTSAPAARSQVKQDWRIGIDLVFFQYADTGIAKVWESLLKYFENDSIRDSIVLFIRKDSPFIPSNAQKFRSIEVPSYDYENKEQDAYLIDWACEQEDVCVFVSTYMTYSHCKHNVVMIHDCIPERVAKSHLNDPMWDAKKAAISNADSILTISDYSANEIQAFYPETRTKSLFITQNSIRQSFLEATSTQEILQNSLNEGYPAADYCLLVGERNGYLGYKNGALAMLAIENYNSNYNNRLELKVVGGWRSDSHPLSVFDLEPELLTAASKIPITRSVVDDKQLIALYKNAVCLIYLSEDEGFGLPIYECLASGGQVIVLDRPFNRNINHPNLIKVQDSSATQVSRAISDAHSRMNDRIKLSGNSDLLSSILGQSQNQGQKVSEILQLIQLSESGEPARAPLHDNIITNKFESLSEASRYILDRHPANARSAESGSVDKYKFGYITSTYKSSLFFGQLVKDVLASNMTPSNLQAKITIEHIVIDSNSPEDEILIYQKADIDDYCSYLYYKTPHRESLYSAWNRGARLSESTYISNANTDDRHSPYFAYIASLFLDSHPDIMLAYSDQIITETPNTLYTDETSRRRWAWPQYNYTQLLIGNHVGSTPVWRRSVHSNIGYFNGDYKCAGDWDFWLRIATESGALGLINLPISSYLFNPSGIEHGSPLQSLHECREIQKYYGTFGEYSISDRDKESRDKSQARTLDDMQYSGVTGDRLTLIAINEWNSSTILDILSIGQFDASADIRILLLSDETIPALAQQPFYMAYDDMMAISQAKKEIDLYVHNSSFRNVDLPSRSHSRAVDILYRSLQFSECQPTEVLTFLFYSGIRIRSANP